MSSASNIGQRPPVPSHLFSATRLVVQPRQPSQLAEPAPWGLRDSSPTPSGLGLWAEHTQPEKGQALAPRFPRQPPHWSSLPRSKSANCSPLPSEAQTPRLSLHCRLLPRTPFIIKGQSFTWASQQSPPKRLPCPPVMPLLVALFSASCLLLTECRVPSERMSTAPPSWDTSVRRHHKHSPSD